LARREKKAAISCLINRGWVEKAMG